MEQLFSKYHFFQECIIKDIKLNNHLSSITIIFNYIWEDGKIRRNIEREKLLKITFDGVSQFKIENHIPMSYDKDNWSLDEISCIKIISDNTIKILWEVEKSILITFQQVSVVDLNVV